MTDDPVTLVFAMGTQPDGAFVLRFTRGNLRAEVAVTADEAMAMVGEIARTVRAAGDGVSEEPK
jgi:hypothetical protein